MTQRFSPVRALVPATPAGIGPQTRARLGSADRGSVVPAAVVASPPAAEESRALQR